MIRNIFLTISTISLIAYCNIAYGSDFESDIAPIRQLVKEKKYLSAAQNILSNEKFPDNPQLVQEYTHILTEYFATAINFRFFGLRDLEKDEEIIDIRGKAGSYTIVGTDLAEFLFKQYAKNKKSPHINFAIGTYLSRGELCRCITPEYFKDDLSGDYQYYIFAYENGIFDYWSLFRIGIYYHNQGNEKISTAAKFYELSIQENNTHTEAIFNLALIRFSQNKLSEAKRLASLTAEQYIDNNLKSDAYSLLGRIQINIGSAKLAKKSFKESLKLKKWHAESFLSLLYLYKEEKNDSEYTKLVSEYISIDYSNTFLFNQYINFLYDYKISEIDRKTIELLSKVKLEDNISIGAFNFNLGRGFELLEEKEQSLMCFKLALKALSDTTNPPEGAIKALNQLIERNSQ